MEPNQNNKSNQPVEKKSNQPAAPEVKNETTISKAPIVIPAKQQEKVPPVKPVAIDNKKTSEVPDAKEPKTEPIKAETKGEAAPVEKKKV